jgi:hypothetical protein
MNAQTHALGRKIIVTNDNPVWRYEDGETYDPKNPRPCIRCGKKPDKDEHDPCIKNLPGVKNACCGHGVDKGYIQFENGVTIRGIFKVEKS